MRYYSVVLLAGYLNGCTLWPADFHNKERPPHAEQMHQLDHLSTDIDLLISRGVKTCLPGQWRQLVNLHNKATQEAQAGFKDDANLTMLATSEQIHLIKHQLDWLEQHTQCIDHPHTETELKEKFLILMAVDNQFATDKYELLPGYQDALTSAAEILRRQTHWKIQLIGFADSRGNPQYNHTLGINRAKAVKRFLIEQGISSHQLNVDSYGEEKSKQDKSSHTLQLANRKVTAQILVDFHTQSHHRIYSIKDWHHAKEPL